MTSRSKQIISDLLQPRFRGVPAISLYNSKIIFTEVIVGSPADGVRIGTIDHIHQCVSVYLLNNALTRELVARLLCFTGETLETTENFNM